MLDKINMKNIIYWIWLQQSLGFGNFKTGKLMSCLNSIEEFYELGGSYWRCLSIFTKKELEKLEKNDLSSASKILEKALRLGYGVLGFSDSAYPDLLRKIPDPPCVLYIKGNADCILGNSISIVGSRNATCYGISMAFEIARDLARSGVAIVSGGAIGADSAAHRGAIKAGGQTVAVLACGIDFHYLMQNASLRYEISQNGALISEYPPGYPVQNFNFPVRNRLISALSPGTVVIEASKRSGAIITANFAVEQNRDVFVIPVPKESPLSEGIFPLIDDGAKVITSAGDIMYSIFKTNRIFENNIRQNKKNINHETASTLNFKNQDNNTNTNKNKLKNLSKELIVILNIIKKGKIHIDEIKIKTSFPTKQILAGLTKLEILGLVRSLPGRFYNLS